MLRSRAPHQGEDEVAGARAPRHPQQPLPVAEGARDADLGPAQRGGPAEGGGDVLARQALDDRHAVVLVVVGRERGGPGDAGVALVVAAPQRGVAAPDAHVRLEGPGRIGAHGRPRRGRVHGLGQVRGVPLAQGPRGAPWGGVPAMDRRGAAGGAGPRDVGGSDLGSDDNFTRERGAAHLAPADVSVGRRACGRSGKGRAGPHAAPARSRREGGVHNQRRVGGMPERRGISRSLAANGRCR